MKRKFNPGELARARRERGKITDVFGGQIDLSGGIGMIHLAGAVGLRINVSPAQRDLAENLLQRIELEVPYVFKESK